MAKACATVPSGVANYDTEFPTSPLNAVLSQKGATSVPVFALNGKAVPTTSTTGAFAYKVPKPALPKSSRNKNDEWSTVRVHGASTKPGGSSSKATKSASGVSTTEHSTTSGDVLPTSKASLSPATTREMKGTNNGKNSYPSKPKATGVSFNGQTGNKFQTLCDSGDCSESMSTQ